MLNELPRPYQDFHLLEAWDVPEPLFTDPLLFKATSLQLIEATGLTVVGFPDIHPYQPEGFSLNAFLAESGVNVHTWRELSNYMNFLFHTCSRKVNFENIPEIASNILQTHSIEFNPLTIARNRMIRRASGLSIPR